MSQIAGEDLAAGALDGGHGMLPVGGHSRLVRRCHEPAGRRRRGCSRLQPGCSAATVTAAFRLVAVVSVAADETPAQSENR
jgi:hypothetical protein